MNVGGTILNQDELDRFLEKQIPRALRYGTAFTLNELAFRAKSRFFEGQQGAMTMRNRGFAKKSTRVKKTSAVAIDRQMSVMYTQAIDRSTGWIEQPIAGADRRKRKFVKKARRGGTERGTVIGRYRMKPGRSYAHLSKSENMADLYYYMRKHNGLDEPVVVYDNDYGIKPGVIRFTKKEIELKRKERGVKGKLKPRRGNLIFRIAYARRGRVKLVDIVDREWRTIEPDVLNVWEEKLTEQFSRTISI